MVTEGGRGREGEVTEYKEIGERGEGEGWGGKVREGKGGMHGGINEKKVEEDKGGMKERRLRWEVEGKG